MPAPFWFRRRGPSARAPQRRNARPRLETLEGRLPPGDLLGAALLGGLLDPMAPADPTDAVAPAAVNVAPAAAQPAPVADLLPAPEAPALHPAPAAYAAPTETPDANGPDLSPSVVAAGLLAAGAGVAPLGNYTPTAAAGGVLFESAALTPAPSGQPAAAPGNLGSPSGPSLARVITPSLQITDVKNAQGQSVLNGYTNDTRPVVSGVADPGDSVTLYVDGQAAGSGQADDSGQWSITPDNPLSAGAHELAVGPTGESAPTSPAVQVTMDTEGPTVTLEAPTHAPDRAPVVTVTASDNHGFHATVAVDLDLNKDGDFDDAGEQDQTTATLGEGTTSFTLNELPRGNFLVRARVTDWAGNVGVSDPSLVRTPMVRPGASGLGSLSAGIEVGGEGIELPDGGDGGDWTPPNGVVLDRSPVNESEPNDTNAAANVLTLTPNEVHIVNGSIASTTDVDFFSFTITARAGVFIDIDAREIGLSNLDSVVALFLGSSTTALDSNDNGYDFDTGWPAQFRTASATTADSALYRDLTVGLTGSSTYVIRVSGAGGTTGAYQLRVRTDPTYTNTVPVLNSLPNAADTLYLDFDGHTSTGDAWRSQGYTIPAFNFPGSSANEFTPGERLAILNIWKTVAEDYAPFNINVSTQQPGQFSDGVDFRMVVGGGNGSQINQTGNFGVAFLNSYASGGTGDQLAFAFFDVHPDYMSGGGGQSGRIMAQAQDTGGTISHEFGHALGLEHFDNNVPPENAPNDISLMFNGSLGLGRYIWRSANNVNSQPQDDMAVISNTTNTFGYRSDDHGNTAATATVLTPDDKVYLATGVISQVATDSDFFRFNATSGGPTVIRVEVDDFVGNLNAVLRLYDAAGNLLAVDAPTNSFDAQLSLDLADATYFVEVDTAGAPGEAGQYVLVITVPNTPAPPGPGGGGGNPNFDGDGFESNETSDAATDLGALAAGSSTLSNLTINTTAQGFPDYDWFRWTAGQAGTFTATMTVTEAGTLELHLFTLQGNTLVELGTASAAAPNPAAVGVQVSLGQVILVEVKGRNSALGVQDQGKYDLVVSLT